MVGIFASSLSGCTLTVISVCISLENKIVDGVVISCIVLTFLLSCEIYLRRDSASISSVTITDVIERYSFSAIFFIC